MLLFLSFSDVTAEVLTSTKKMEESLRRLKKARGGEKEKEKTGGVSDSDKIRNQLIIDIKSFQNQVLHEALEYCLKKTKSKTVHWTLVDISLFNVQEVCDIAYAIVLKLTMFFIMNISVIIFLLIHFWILMFSDGKSWSST